MSERRQKGFTLPELLVALLIFAFVAAACVYSLRLGVDARDQLAKADDRLAEMQIARAIIREDMLQLVNRPVRDEFGDFAGPAFLGGSELRLRRRAEGETPLLAFVRRGWTNPESQAPRSTLQYVEYVEKGGALVRRIRPYLDDARNQPEFERALFADAADVEISFLAGEARGELDWAQGWPIVTAALFPRAIAVTFTSARFGRLTQRFWIGRLDTGGGAG